MQMDLNENNLPENLTNDSVFYACDGPKEQQIRDLKRIKSLCETVKTTESLELLNEANEALEELEK